MICSSLNYQWRFFFLAFFCPRAFPIKSVQMRKFIASGIQCWLLFLSARRHHFDFKAKLFSHHQMRIDEWVCFHLCQTVSIPKLESHSLMRVFAFEWVRFPVSLPLSLFSLSLAFGFICQFFLHKNFSPSSSSSVAFAYRRSRQILDEFRFRFDLSVDPVRLSLRLSFFSFLLINNPRTHIVSVFSSLRVELLTWIRRWIFSPLLWMWKCRCAASLFLQTFIFY